MSQHPQPSPTQERDGSTHMKTPPPEQSMAEDLKLTKAQERRLHQRAETVAVKAIALFEEIEETCGEWDELTVLASGAMTSAVELANALQPAGRSALSQEGK